MTSSHLMLKFAIIRRRWIRDNDGDHHLINLSLYRERNSSVIPFIMIEAGYIATLTERVRERACFIEAHWPQRLSGTIIRSICTMFVIDRKSGQRLHLRSHFSNVRLSRAFTGLSGKGRSYRVCASGAHEGLLSCRVSSEHLSTASGLTYGKHIGLR